MSKDLTEIAAGKTIEDKIAKSEIARNSWDKRDKQLGLDLSNEDSRDGRSGQPSIKLPPVEDAKTLDEIAARGEDYSVFFG